METVVEVVLILILTVAAAYAGMIWCVGYVRHSMYPRAEEMERKRAKAFWKEPQRPLKYPKDWRLRKAVNDVLSPKILDGAWQGKTFNEKQAMIDEIAADLAIKQKPRRRQRKRHGHA